MDFDFSPKVVDMMTRINLFMEDHVYPAEQPYFQFLDNSDNRWAVPPIMDELKAKAKSEGLWNLFLPDSEYGLGLSNLEYAPLAEITGRSPIGAEVFNCSAPDSGNIETLVRYGSAEQKEKWLVPLLEGDIRSAFAMTEPAVASSDATNIECEITLDGDEYVINGIKWWTSGAMDPRCEILIVMGKTAPEHENRYKQQSMILVPLDQPGVKIIRPLRVFGDYDAPHGHAEIEFNNVRVPTSNILLGEGRGFEIAQGRLGPGRIHHCMRLIGAAQRALEEMCRRAQSRMAFGKQIADLGSVKETIARSQCEIEQARLLTLAAADKMDKVGNKEAREHIAMIKIVAPRMAQNVLDRAIQIHGGGGVSQDFNLARSWALARTVRLADGPDEVHMTALTKQILRNYSPSNRSSN